MLINSFEHSVDAKGRVFIPAKWRDDLGDTVIVTRGITGGESKCLFGMPLSVWNQVVERFSKVAMTDVRAQNGMRLMFANACDCEPDKQGRILVAAGLREYAGIDKDAVLIGMGNRIEIWNAETWRQHSAEQETLEQEALSYLAELGI